MNTTQLLLSVHWWIRRTWLPCTGILLLNICPALCVFFIFASLTHESRPCSAENGYWNKLDMFLTFWLVKAFPVIKTNHLICFPQFVLNVYLSYPRGRGETEMTSESERIYKYLNACVFESFWALLSLFFIPFFHNIRMSCCSLNSNELFEAGTDTTWIKRYRF